MKIIIVSLALIVCWVSCAPTDSSTAGTTKEPFVKLSCKGHKPDALFVDDKDPATFHQCSHGQHIATYHCQANTVFDEAEQVCVRPHTEHFKCPEQMGTFPYPGNIHKFIECYEGRPYVRTCAADLIFDDKKDECIYNDGNSPWPSDPTTEATTKAPKSTPAVDAQ